MPRLSPFAVLAGLVAAVVLVAASRSEPGVGATPPPPNLLVLMTDDQTLESVRVMANVRRLAVEGTTFANAFASFPVCCPSRATFLTGQYAHNHGVMSNHAPRGGSQKLDHLNTIGLWLQAAGYRTVHLGKYLNGYGKDGSPVFTPGAWSEWYGSLDPSTYNFLEYTLMENGRRVSYPATANSYQTDFYGRRGAEFVRRLAARPEPFFLFVGFLAPHVGWPVDPDDPTRYRTPSPAARHRDAFAKEPLPRPPSFNEADVSDKPPGVRRRARLTKAQIRDVRELYQQRLESLLAVDEAIGRIVDELRRSGELGRTLIVFTSDNGFLHGEHRIPQGKVVPYEPSIRVPLILRGPGIPRGAVQRDQVPNVDLAATLLDAAGADGTRLLDGKSLLPLAADPAMRLGRDVLLEAGTYRGIRTPKYKYVEYIGGARELYDLEADPHELRSRHADPALASVRAELRARLWALESCIGEACSSSPRVRLAVGGGDPCVSTAASVRVEGADLRRVRHAHFRLAGKSLRVITRAPFAAGVDGTRLGGSETLLRVRVRLRDGREVTLDRPLRRC